ncbi:MAG: MarR family winged helix-turn-helix transcriptional regulator [Gaiellaceae bacterium]
MGLSNDDPALRAWRAFLNAHARVIRLIEADLAAAELPPLGWYDVLWALYRASEQRLRIHELAEEVVLSRTGMSRLVDRIERAGMLRREPVPNDGRGAYAVITEAGVELLRRMWPVYERGIERLFAEPVGGDADALRQSLERIGAAALTR